MRTHLPHAWMSRLETRKWLVGWPDWLPQFIAAPTRRVDGEVIGTTAVTPKQNIGVVGALRAVSEAAFFREPRHIHEEIFMSKRDNTTLKCFDDLPNAAAVDVKTVAALCGCSISTVWERSRRGALPEPIKIGGSARWNVGKLRAILG